MRAALIALAAGAVLSAPVAAHHGSAAFEPGKMMTVTGTVTQYVYSNPHLLLMIDVNDDAGAVAKWVLETQAPNVMYPAGYRKDTFKPGDVITVTLQPAKNGRTIGRILKVVTASGWTLGFINDVPIPPKP